MKKVGKYVFKDKDKTLSYKTVVSDIDGWVDASKYLPADYDLMYLKIKNKPTTHGWVFGTKWDGLKVQPDDEVLYWKKKQESVS
jgi:hypothetical protein